MQQQHRRQVTIYSSKFWKSRFSRKKKWHFWVYSAKSATFFIPFSLFMMEFPHFKLFLQLVFFSSKKSQKVAFFLNLPVYFQFLDDKSGTLKRNPVPLFWLCKKVSNLDLFFWAHNTWKSGQSGVQCATFLTFF